MGSWQSDQLACVISSLVRYVIRPIKLASLIVNKFAVLYQPVLKTASMRNSVATTKASQNAMRGVFLALRVVT